MQKMFIEDKT